MFNMKRLRKYMLKNITGTFILFFLAFSIIKTHDIEENFGCPKLHKHRVTKMLLFTNLSFFFF
jgi:hypothetical protein